MSSFIAVAILSLLTSVDYTICLDIERENDRCEIMTNKIISDDRTTVSDNTPNRLHYTWLSQQCEVRIGPKYVIRKYSFFENGTFLLLQYHYAEDSCSIATYTVVARGSIEISSPSITVPGATEANVQLFSVHLIPFNRQIAHKFGHKMNSSCGGIETKWRPYSSQLIYEHPGDFPSTVNDYELNSNSLQSRLPRPRKQHTLDCLEFFGIEFIELRLLRVEIKQFSLATNSSNRKTNDTDKQRGRVELLLGELTRNVRSEKAESVPNRLQSTTLLRADTAIGCPICGSVFRATEFSPPLFHQIPLFPAVIGGRWLSVRCESVDGGFWSRRFFRIYSEDNRWSARWTYYADPTCSNSLYVVTAAGNYIQRAFGQKRSGTSRFRRVFNTRNSERLSKRTFNDDVDANKFKDVVLPFGTTELELQIVESLSIPVSNAVSTLCGRTMKGSKETKKVKGVSAKSGKSSILYLWSKSCVPRTVQAPATLLFKAKVSLDWNGDYILLLASWKDDLWNAPLYRCSGIASRNYFRTENSLRGSLHEYSYHLPFFKARNRFKRLSRHGRHWFSSTFSSYFLTSGALFAHPAPLLLLYCFLAVNKPQFIE
nr:PREDICTED: protein APCDD1-like isoform X1 [Megachile rotundata]XP_012139511.1 PREDICTED: protein APCDD1-like isoform X1 [Megachile rotundata]